MCVCVRERACVYVCMFVCVHVCICMYMYVLLLLFVLFVRMYVCIHACIHIYTACEDIHIDIDINCKGLKGSLIHGCLQKPSARLTPKDYLRIITLAPSLHNEEVLIYIPRQKIIDATQKKDRLKNAITQKPQHSLKGARVGVGGWGGGVQWSHRPKSHFVPRRMACKRGLLSGYVQDSLAFLFNCKKRGPPRRMAEESGCAINFCNKGRSFVYHRQVIIGNTLLCDKTSLDGNLGEGERDERHAGGPFGTLWRGSIRSGFVCGSGGRRPWGG